MAAYLDVCRFNPTSGGTTDWTYSSAVTGYQSPSAAGVVNGRAYKYRAESSDLSQWEVGEGTYNTGTGVLSRDTVLYNSSGTTSKINFSAAPQVAIVALKDDLSVGAAKAWVTFAGSTGTVQASHGVTRVSRSGAGQYVVTFSTAFASATGYACIGSTEHNAANTVVKFGSGAGKTTTTMSVYVVNLSGTLTDPDYVNVAAYGAQ